MIGTAASLMLAGGAFSAATAIGAGNAQAKNIKRQAEYNAEIYDQQATMIKEQKNIQDKQFRRQAAQARGSIVSQTAGKGLMLSGSPLAILIDNETNMQFDKAIADYNLSVEENYAMSGATYQRQSGAVQSRMAKWSGYSNAFQTMLSTGTQVGMMSLTPKTPKIPARKA